MAFIRVLFLCGTVSLALGQRGSFAGKRPIGFPITETTTDGLGNRFGEDSGSTERLPLEALGDRDLVNRISKLPKDQQPFWYLNWQALEAHRKNPQTFQERPNVFIENNPRPTVSGAVPVLGNRNSGDLNSLIPVNTQTSTTNGVTDRSQSTPKPEPNQNKVANVHNSQPPKKCS